MSNEGLKYEKLLELGDCALCGRKMLAPPPGTDRPPDLTFYVVRLRRAMWDGRAIQRAVGLELQLGSPALARVMGPDEDLAKVFDDREVAVHESCAHRMHSLLELREKETT